MTARGQTQKNELDDTAQCAAEVMQQATLCKDTQKMETVELEQRREGGF